MVRPCLAPPYKGKPFSRTPDLACLTAPYMKLYVGGVLKLCPPHKTFSKYHAPENRMSLPFLLSESIKNNSKILVSYNRYYD